MKKNFLTALDL